MRIEPNSSAGPGPELDALTRAGRQLADGAPGRDAMLGQVYLRNSQFKEQPMNPIARIFAGRGIAARLAIAALLLLTLAAVTTFLPESVRLVNGTPRVEMGRPALSSTNGVVLTWDLSGQVAPGATPEATHNQLLSLLEQFKAAKASVTPPAGVEVKLINRVEQRSKHVKPGDGAPATEEVVNVIEASFMLSAADSRLQQALTDAVAAKVPAAGAPKVSDATWFSENGGMIEDGIHIALNVNGRDRTFTFPMTATEAEVESTIRQWLSENNPEFPGTVDVTIDDSTGPSGEQERRIEIRVETKDHAGE